MIKKISVLGDGGWGTTLAIHLFKKGYDVCLWGAFPKYVKFISKKRINSKFLPHVKIPKQVFISSDLKEIIQEADLVILAIPSMFMRRVITKITQLDVSKKIFLSVAKGIENYTLMRMSEVIRDVLGRVDIAVLSGPTIAMEVATNIPSTAVVASEKLIIAEKLQDVLMTDRLRIYTNQDIKGVELGGSLKNVIAIACGISDGLGFGVNTKAALLSRGLNEMVRLGKAMGAESLTFTGLSGLGDLVTTCFSPFSRNRYVGQQIGRGVSFKQVLKKMAMIAEGVTTVKSVYRLSWKYSIEMPIVKEIYSVLYRKKCPLKAVNDLMKRKRKYEFA